MADRLESLLNRFELRAQLFFSGALCELSRFSADQGLGHVHVVSNGAVELESARQGRLEIRAPAVLFLLEPSNHRLKPVAGTDAELACMSVEFGGHHNPLTAVLSNPLAIPLREGEAVARVVDLLLSEARHVHCGRQAALDRLCELLVIHLLRYVMDAEQADVGVLAGLADSHLAKAINAIHDRPAEPWTLERLAREAGMSRAPFAATFKRLVGVTPGDYLARWRLALAQSLLRKRVPTAFIADQVGYGSAASFSRAFRKQFGESPRSWLRAQSSGTGGAD